VFKIIYRTFYNKISTTQSTYNLLKIPFQSTSFGFKLNYIICNKKLSFYSYNKIQTVNKIQTSLPVETFTVWHKQAKKQTCIFHQTVEQSDPDYFL